MLRKTVRTGCGPPKPKLRGISHLHASWVAVIAGTVLVTVSAEGRPRNAMIVYAVTLAAMFGASALYHLPNWRPSFERWMRCLDHSTIFLFIAGSSTPFCLLALWNPHGPWLLATVWAFAALGVLRALFWVDAPPWVCASIYVLQGSLMVPFLPGIAAVLGPACCTLLVIGGLCYIIGAVVFSIGRPDPMPAVFGYHEVFHVLVIAGCALQFVAVGRLATLYP